ncbi:MAG: phosphoadenosine phosphosulfate reductase family protein, partial [Bacteroidales bacterium]|nr:phosphoadenosine phosphosulfate reductase family protein [Bacteroidales bacterium]
MEKALATKLNDKLAGLSPEEILSSLVKDFDGKIGFSTSLGAEDQIITHMLAGIDKSTPIFTLDTGRLFQETYDLLYITENKYNIKITVYFPYSKQVEKMVNENGINLFYESIEKRKLCCHIRKIEPLKRAMDGLDAWICGLRRDQLTSRQNRTVVEWDEL